MSRNLDLPIGTIVTGYQKGIYEVIKVVPRYQSTKPDARFYTYEYTENEFAGERIGDLVTLKCLYNGKLKPIKATSTCECDSSFCTPIVEIAHEQIKDLQRQISVYKNILNIKDE